MQCNDPIPVDATAVHGISNDDLINAPTWPEIHDQVCAILAGADHLYIYNAEYDIRLLHQTAARHNKIVPELTNAECVMNRYARKYNSGYRKKLVKACSTLDINIDDLTAHSAISDCEMTRRLHIKMGEINKKKPTSNKEIGG